jgi:acetyl-CoA carboxylase biotin carboxylase subunit
VPDDKVAEIAGGIGYPVMVKAVAGGGGKGLRVVWSRGELAGAIRAARSEAASSFGDPAIYVERRLTRPRHVEVQLLADTHGTVVPFVERECSIQRRHQKVIEETPSPAVTPALRARMTEAAASVAAGVGYTNAGTIEFLLDEDGSFYFLEMNTRLQVEHPITETVTGTDLVQWQIRIAAGEKLTIDPAAALAPRGHAIECRIIAEDPDSGFMPSPGRIRALRLPAGPGIRHDSGYESGSEVPIFYDPMIAKLIAWGEDRDQAIARMRRALVEYEVVGIRTSVPFFRWMFAQHDFLAAQFDTTSLDRLLKARQGEPFIVPGEEDEEVATIAAALHAAGSAVRDPQSPIRSSLPEGGGQRHGESGSRRADRGSRWKDRARLEALRP